MEWTQITINVKPADVDLAGDIANMTVPYGIYIEDYTDLEQGVRDIAHIDLIDEDLLAKDRDIAKIHIYIDPEDSPAEAIAFLTERYDAEGIEHTIEEEKCEEEEPCGQCKGRGGVILQERHHTLPYSTIKV